TLTRLLRDSERETKAARGELRTTTDHLARLETDRRSTAEEVSRTIAALLNDSHASIWGERAALKRKMKRMRQSGLFDGKWYLSYYTDVAEAGYDPLYHYVRYGAREGRAPNASLAPLLESA